MRVVSDHVECVEDGAAVNRTVRRRMRGPKLGPCRGFCAGVLLVASSLLAAQDSPSFARYSIILTRMPFGGEATAVTTETPAEDMAAPAESISKALVLCAITRDHDTGKIQVGLMDLATRKSYFLGKGDKEDGMEVKEADYVEEKALLRKGGRDVWLTMDTPGVVRNPFGTQVAPSPPRSPNTNESGTMTLAALGGEEEPADVTLKRLIAGAQGEASPSRGAKDQSLLPLRRKMDLPANQP
jgi:hypothetical protein